LRKDTFLWNLPHGDDLLGMNPFFKATRHSWRQAHPSAVSDIIDVSTLVPNLLRKEAAKHIEHIDTLDPISEVIVWSDCGPNSKSHDHCAGWIGE